jgi:hypothetical protein
VHAIVREGICTMVSNLFERMNICVRVELVGSTVHSTRVCSFAYYELYCQPEIRRVHAIVREGMCYDDQ